MTTAITWWQQLAAGLLGGAGGIALGCWTLALYYRRRYSR